MLLVQVLRVAQGDMRKGITFLQSAASLYGNTITPEGVVEISGVFPDKEVEASVSGGHDGGVRLACIPAPCVGCATPYWLLPACLPAYPSSYHVCAAGGDQIGVI